MAESNVVTLHKERRRPVVKAGEEKLADDIRKLYRKLCKAIDQATIAGLKVKVFLDSDDTYGGGRVRERTVEITKKL